MPTSPPSTRTVIERALDETIARLSRLSPTPEVRGYLIEARRLRSLMATWRAIPPPAEARREMLAKVMHLAAAAGSAAPASQADMPAVSAPIPAVEFLEQQARAEVMPRAATLPAPQMVDRPSQSDGRRISLAPGISVVDADSVPWTTLRDIANIGVKLLHHDVSRARITMIVRMQPGATMPAHRHEQLEEILVIDGSATLGDHHFSAGAYCRAEPGSVHAPLRTDEGCTFLVKASDHDEFVDSNATPAMGIEGLLEGS